MLGRSKQTVKRSEVVDSTPTNGLLVKVTKPKFLSLVGLPANSTGFKVLRSDTGETTMSQPTVRRTRRSDSSPVLKVTFPTEFTEDQAKQAMETYGLTGYTLSQEGSVYVAQRSDLKSIANDASVMDIKLAGGVTATVKRSTTPVAEDKASISLVRFEFDSEKFTEEEVRSWATEHKVDGDVVVPQNAGESYVVRRSEVAENEETRVMEVEDGVTAVITRSDDPNIPDGFVAVVSEAAYGSWGWGQLDFVATMADREFSEQMDEAIYTLRGVLERVVLYSPLPLDVRKGLVNRALEQFGDFVGVYMDSLPRQLLVSVVRSATLKQESDMTQKAGGTTTADTKATGEQAPAPSTVSREDVQGMIKEAVGDLTTQVAALTEALKRKDEPAATGEEAKQEEPKPASETLTRADLEAAMAAAIKPLAEKVETLSGTTVVRGDSEATQATETKTGKKQDVFRGALPGLRKHD